MQFPEIEKTEKEEQVRWGWEEAVWNQNSRFQLLTVEFNIRAGITNMPLFLE